MTEYVIIEPDGSLVEGDGYPHDRVGCHGVGGQMLWSTRKYVDGVAFTYRMLGCDCALLMPEQHPENIVASAVLAGLGYGESVRGRIAIVQVCLLDNDQVPFTPKQLEALRRLVTVGRTVRTLCTSNPAMKAYTVDVDSEGQLRIDELLPPKMEGDASQ